MGQGILPLSDLADEIAQAQRVVALVAASDVTLLSAKTPPLSPAKLKAALPHLVEDQLIGDPADCAVIAGSLVNGERTVAVMQRAWLTILAKTLNNFGARDLKIFPAQLCLPYEQDEQPPSLTPTERTVLQDRRRHSSLPGVIAAINEQADNVQLTLRLSEHHGIGLTVHTEMHPSGQSDIAIQEVIQTLSTLVPQAPVVLYVPEASVRTYQTAIAHAETLNKRISVLADNWSYWITGAEKATLNLMAGINGGTGSSVQWRPWRWPLLLATTIILINVIALNIDWLRSKREAQALRTSMIQIYKTAYPKESVIIDPLAQLRQKITAAKRAAGVAAPDDFTVLTAAFGEAWATVGKGTGQTPAINTLAISGFDYQERTLLVRLKPSPTGAHDSEALTQQIKAALAERRLTLESTPGESGAVTWKIRSAE